MDTLPLPPPALTMPLPPDLQRMEPRLGLPPVLSRFAPPARPTLSISQAKPAQGAALHSHRCRSCGTVWSHTDASFGNVADHSCPKCGKVEWTPMRPDGRLPPPILQRNAMPTERLRLQAPQRSRNDCPT